MEIVVAIMAELNTGDGITKSMEPMTFSPT